MRNLLLFTVIPSLLIGCASKATLEKEEKYVENLLRHETVEDFLEETPEVDQVLDLGGNKVRYTIIYTPTLNLETLYIIDKRRHYRLYVYVAETGEISKTHYKLVYDTEFRPNRGIVPAMVFLGWFYQEFIKVGSR